MTKTIEAQKVEKAKDALKLKELLKVGAQQSATSAGQYLNFALAVSLIERRWGVRFNQIETEEAAHEWSKKFGTLVAGVNEHDVDRSDGYCLTCGKYHSGDPFDVVRFTQTKAFQEKVKTQVVCTNVMIEEDGYCDKCGQNHFGGERVAKGDDKAIAALRKEKKSPFSTMKNVTHRELRIDTKLWKMGEIAQLDILYEE